MSGDPAQASAPRPPATAGPPPGKSASIWLRFWSRVSASKWLLGVTVVVVLLILFGLFLGGMAAFDWSESTPFCSLCHVMKPEVTAYRGSPHSRVDCGTCHVGPGPIPAVQAKLANVRYVWEAPTGLYPRPIPSPITSLRPVEVVCEQCHWPEKFYQDRLLTLSRYAQDQTNSPTRIDLLLKTGGGTQKAGLGRGIHWHIENAVYYIATDEQRQDIPWVQATFNGKTTEYLSTDSKLTPEQIAGAQKRKVDCIDCHNRATHIFQRPSEALDAAMATGAIAADLPFIKREGTRVLETTYTTEQEAATAIAGVEDFYRTQYADVYAQRKADVQKAVAGLQAIFDNTQFPFMKVTWETHPNNIGHMDFAGCFRCHDGKHVSKDNLAIRLECNICHSLPEVITPGQANAVLPLTTGTEPDSHKSTTWLLEHRTRFDATCANCHTVENAGGTDNSSFCSNSACHGISWKFAGLSAPQLPQPAKPPQGAPPAIPHTLVGRDNCLVCHNPVGGIRPAPKDHEGRTNDMCQGCHKPAASASPAATPAAGSGTAVATTTPAAAGGGGPPAIPHTLVGRDNCLVCHNPVGGIRPALKDHEGRTNDTCQGCHKPAASASPAATPAAGSGTTVATTTPAAASGGGPPAIPHTLVGRDNCLICHNPEGGIKPAPKDHAGRTNDMCQGCHKPAP